MYDYADYFVYQLPEPREQFYEHSNFGVVKKAVLIEQEKLMKDLGWYQISSLSPNLSSLQVY